MLVVGSDLWSTPAWTSGFVQAPLGGGAPKQHPANTGPFASDGAHIYWAFSELKRINIATAVEELVAVMPLGATMGVAVTGEWVFANLPYDGIYRVAKPAH